MYEPQDIEMARGPGADTEPASSAKLPTAVSAGSVTSTLVLQRDSKGRLIPGTPLDCSSREELKLDGYEFLSLLGSGAVGSVYLARQKSLSRYVAVKVIHAEGTALDMRLSDLREEAKTLATLSHPNIVDCYDIIHSGRGLYLVMEYIPGHMTVRSMVERLGVVPGHIMTRILLDLVKGLLYISARGILHRDLKPANLMVLHPEENPAGSYQMLFGDTSTRMLICDFGIAKHMEAIERHDTVVGSPMYMSPEQARGEENLDCRSDIYSLGCVAYFMLTGQLPFTQTDENELLEYKMEHGVPDPREVNPNVNDALSRIVVKMGRADANDRYKGYGELLAELEKLATEESVWFAESEKKLTKRMQVRYILYTVQLFFGILISWFFYDTILKPQFQPAQMSLTETLGYWYQDGHAGWTHIFAEPREPTDFWRSWKGEKRVPLVLMQPLKNGMTMDFCLRFFGPGKVVCGFLRSDGTVLMSMEWERQGHMRDKLRLLCGDEQVSCGLMPQASQLEWTQFSLKLEGERIVASLRGKTMGALYVEDTAHDCYFFVDTTLADAADLKNVYRLTGD